MSINKTAYFIKIVETDIDKPDIDIDGIMADEFEETLPDFLQINHIH